MERNIGFIGAGHMAGAMIDGLLASGKIAPGVLGVCDISETRLDFFRARGLRVYESIPALVSACAVVFLCVKPQTADEVLPSVREGLRPDTILVSIVAGLTGERLCEALGNGCRTVLAMPNTPIELGFGAVALGRVEPATPQDIQTVAELLGACAVVEEVPPAQMAVVTAVCGSMPAFLYQMASVVIDEAARMGLNEDAARALFCQTMIGSAKMLLRGRDARKLVAQVATPGGTTAAALAEMERLGHDDALRAGFQACVQKAQAMGK